MKACPNCGVMVEDNTMFCASCGVKIEEAEAPVAEPAQKVENNIPPVGTPVHTPTPQVQSANQQCFAPQLCYMQRPTSGMMAWAIILLIASVLFGSVLTIAMEIIAIIALGDAKVAVTKQIFEHKLKVAKVLNVISTVIVAFMVFLTIVLGSLFAALFGYLINAVESEFPQSNSFFQEFEEEVAPFENYDY